MLYTIVHSTNLSNFISREHAIYARNKCHRCELLKLTLRQKKSFSGENQICSDFYRITEQNCWFLLKYPTPTLTLLHEFLLIWEHYAWFWTPCDCATIWNYHSKPCQHLRTIWFYWWSILQYLLQIGVSYWQLFYCGTKIVLLPFFTGNYCNNLFWWSLQKVYKINLLRMMSEGWVFYHM